MAQPVLRRICNLEELRESQLRAYELPALRAWAASPGAALLVFERRLELRLLQRLQIHGIFCLRERALERLQLRCHRPASRFQARNHARLFFACASNLVRFPRGFLTRVLLSLRSRFGAFAGAALGFRFGFPFSRLRLEFA